MPFEETMLRLGLGASAELFRPHWEESEACLPPDGLPFLKPEELEAAFDYGGVYPEMRPLVHETAQRVRESKDLTLLAWHCHQLLWEHISDYLTATVRQWPPLKGALPDELAPVFYAPLALSGVPRVRAFHKKRGVPDEITRSTCLGVQHGIFVYRYFRKAWGQDVGQLNWFRHSVIGDLYEIGRHQYMVKPFKPGQIVCRNAQTGETLAVAQDGLRFRPNGLRFGKEYADEEAQSWTSRLVEDDKGFTGNPISPFGRALRKEVHLPRAQWEKAVEPGAPMLEMHIPSGGQMTPEACRASMQGALDFFPRCFPDRPFRGFLCTSWIFSPNLEEILPADSNMVKWVKEVYLFPTSSGKRSGMNFVFGKNEIDLATAPRDTSLRRAILDHFVKGGELCGGGMFMLTEDFKHFGSQHYCSHWPPACLR